MDIFFKYFLCQLNLEFLEKIPLCHNILSFLNTAGFDLRNFGDFCICIHQGVSNFLIISLSDLFIYFYLFIYFWLHWVFVAAQGLSLFAVSRGYSSLRCTRASHCGSFSCCGAQALVTCASVVAARGLSSCGTRAQLLHGMWDLPGPGLEPVSPALAGRFLTTVPPGKPSLSDFDMSYTGLKMRWMHSLLFHLLKEFVYVSIISSFSV